MSETIRIFIKPATGGDGAKFSVDVATSLTIAELKEEVQKHGPQMQARDQRLIYKGQVMKDERTIDQYGIQGEHVVHMVRGKTSIGGPDSSGAARSPAAAVQGSDMGLGGMLGADSPMMQGLLNNPELMRTIMMSNPQMQQMIEANPQIAQVFNNPQVMRETMQLMQNPNLMREHMRNSDVAMRNIEGMPEGFNHLRRMYETMEPMMSGMGGGGGDNPFAAMLGGAAAQPPAAGAGSVPEGGPNNAPLPNPWSPAAAPAAANPAGDALPGGLGGLGAGIDPSQVAQMMQQPGMQQMMQSVLGNPQIMQAMMQSDPNMRRLVETVPGMREMLADPNMLRSMFTPEVIQAVAQARGLGAGAAPGATGEQPPMGLGGLSSLFGGAAAAPGAGAPPDMSALMSLLGGAGGMGAGGPAGLAGLLGGLGGGFGAVPPVSNPEEAYASQLQQLADMGFVDRGANIRALTATQGNVNAAVERLLGGL